MAGDLPIGTIVSDRYRIIAVLGQGGMGLTYRAWDLATSRPVVLKHPRREMLAKPGFVERFNREARMMAALSHPHVVPITGIGEHDGVPYLTMPFLPGGSLLHHRLRDSSGRPKQMLPATLHLWLPQIADALDYIHSTGIVHRDVKPANVFFNGFWHAFLGDFGIAKIVGETSALEKEQTLTATSMMVGTHDYMAPEMFSPKAAVTGQADQYALAVMVYEILAARRPFTGDKEHLIVEVTTQRVPSLGDRRGDLPASLEAAVHRALAKRPDERFAECRAFVRAALADVPAMQDEPGVARLACPGCGNVLKVKDTVAGRLGRCPRCQKEMMVAHDFSALWLLDEETARTAPGMADAMSVSVQAESAEDPFVRLDAPPQAMKRASRSDGLWATLCHVDPAARWQAIAAMLVIVMVIAAGVGFAAGRQFTVPKAEYTKLLAERDRLKHEIGMLQAAQPAKDDAAAQFNVRPTRVVTPGVTPETLRSQLRALNPDYDGGGIIHYINGKIVEVHLGGKSIKNITPLQGLPLGAIGLERTQVTDLAPLAGMRLRWLNLDELAGLHDISPLKGMPLAELRMARTGVTDLEPLRGMPLRLLHLEGTPVGDLGPLRGMSLELLNLNFVSTYPTFAALAGMPLRELHAHGTAVEDVRALATTALVKLNINHAERIVDLRPLRDLPLCELHMARTKVGDMRGIRGLPLVTLDATESEMKSLTGLEKSRLVRLILAGTAVRDLSPLKGLPLVYLDLNDAVDLADVGPLSGMRLDELHLRGTRVSSLEPLKGMPLRVLNLERTPIVRVDVLSAMPLRYLNLAGTPFAGLGAQR